MALALRSRPLIAISMLWWRRQNIRMPKQAMHDGANKRSERLYLGRRPVTPWGMAYQRDRLCTYDFPGQLTARRCS